MSINKAILIGNVGKDPEIRNLQSGDKIASFSLATSELWKDKMSGERKEKTEWHNISVFNQGLVRLVESYVTKGSKLYVEGKIQTRKYTSKDGTEKYAHEIVLDTFGGAITLLGGEGNGGDSQPAQAPRHDNAPTAANRAKYGNDLDNLNDDDIPF